MSCFIFLILLLSKTLVWPEATRRASLASSETSGTFKSDSDLSTHCVNMFSKLASKDSKILIDSVPTSNSGIIYEKGTGAKIHSVENP